MFTPAEYVVHAFGGVRVVAAVTGRSTQEVYRWLRGVSDGGNGGRIPTKVQLVLLEEAKKRELPISPENLILGGDFG